MVTRRGTETSPSSGSSSPTIMRKSVVLPEPLGPTSPTFSPGFSWKEASTKMSCRPYCLFILEKEIKGKFQASRRSQVRASTLDSQPSTAGLKGTSTIKPTGSDGHPIHGTIRLRRHVHKRQSLGPWSLDRFRK